MLLLPSLLSNSSVLALQDFALYLSESSSWGDGELIWSKQAVPLATGPELTTSYLYKPSKVVNPAASSLWPDVGPGSSIKGANCLQTARSFTGCAHATDATGLLRGIGPLPGLHMPSGP